MPTYTLTAEHNNEAETVDVIADDDASAMLTAIGEIMTRAYPNVQLWARGEITLTNDRGDVVETMAAKS
jgi:hypothetical protein